MRTSRPLARISPTVSKPGPKSEIEIGFHKGAHLPQRGRRGHDRIRRQRECGSISAEYEGKIEVAPRVSDRSDHRRTSVVDVFVAPPT